MNDSCVCADGFTMISSGVCAMQPKGLGASCDPSGVACGDTTYSVCRVDKTDGYCTNACASSDDCSSGYACDTSVTPNTCKRPPDGQGKSCASNTDCAGTEATYCEATMAHSCFQSDCTASDQCFIGYACCPLKVFIGHNLCVPSGCPVKVLP